ncbi:unnamed protein product [Adineta ricciae]|uniref:Uncharacterized protein n=2 Tax=Adineta ricciae TaxID=249248 RepID=A0A814QE05_ADIRI|nr:unnamed protein product [Adineta ricciae]
MSISNIRTTAPNDQFTTSPILTKKPLAFVQPCIRTNDNQLEKNMSFTSDEPFSYVSQTRRLPMNSITMYNHEQSN